MDHWYMLTLVGEDRPGIVAKLTHALFEGGCNLGEASMMRLGGNFTIMLMVGFDGRGKQLTDLVNPVAESLGLHLHVDAIKGELHKHLEPDVRITVYGADRPGIVSEVTGALAEAGLHILDLESDVAGSEDAPIYIMHIEGHAGEGVGSLRAALDVVKTRGVEASLSEIDTLIG
ncbi:glycine cleavage system protein R [Sulfuriflexus sp.]|uniref:glycine cleavage system protein R n=1 Tax=Sulfuriflexus sp. TaxID=2015443 RepID=UPI0028CE6BE0|nr:ACT domain-containing protein [Sulfuriflexus sp.]MDT8404593.1 ACT domain-containing protein [Sulfuriflexus sp.]